MSDLHQFNPGRKSWKMYSKELTSISGDDLTISPYEGEDLILEVSGNGNILFKEDGITYNLADLSNAASSSVNLTNYDDASFGNVDISGNLDISNGVINFFASDEQLLGPDTGIVQKVEDLSNSVGDLSNNLLTSNNDASFNNVDLGNNQANTISSFTRVLVKMVQSIFKFYDIAENLLASISSVADGAGGKLRFYTTNATSGLEVINLTIKESGAFGLGNAEDCGNQYEVLSSKGSSAPPEWKNIYDTIFPLNSVKISYGEWTPPPEMQHQLWVKFAQGRTLVGELSTDTDFAASGNTGGEKNVSLTQAQMPRHTHTQNAHNHLQQQATAVPGGNQVVGIAANGTGYAPNGYTANATATNQYTGGAGSSQSQSDGQAHNNMPPYFVVVYYLRTA
jgi:hypothetical protein